MQLDSHQEEETKTGLINEAAEVVRNPEGEIINAKEQIKNKICVKSGNPQWPAKDKIYNRCPKRGHYAKPCKSSEDNAIQEDQSPEQTIQDTDMATNVGYLQAGAVIPRWKIIHPDDTTTITVHFQDRQADQRTEDDLKGHLSRVRADNIKLVFISNTGSSTSFVTPIFGQKR